MFLEITPADITSITSYSAGLFSDLLPLILILIGLFMGLYIVRAIINII